MALIQPAKNPSTIRKTVAGKKLLLNGTDTTCKKINYKSRSRSADLGKNEKLIANSPSGYSIIVVDDRQKISIR